MDFETIRVIGKNMLVEQLLDEGIEVAIPIRNSGVDLIAYLGYGYGEQVRNFITCPMSFNAFSDKFFTLQPIYEKFPNMLHVFMWGVGSSAQVETYAVTNDDIAKIRETIERATPRSLQTYSDSSLPPSKELIAALEGFRVSQERWPEVIAKYQQDILDHWKSGY